MRWPREMFMRGNGEGSCLEHATSGGFMTMYVKPIQYCKVK